MHPSTRAIALLVLGASCGSAGSTPRSAPSPATTPAGEPAQPVATQPGAPAGTAFEADGASTLPGFFSRHHVFLRATVGGVPALLLFDSGASATILRPRLVERLGLAYRGRHLAFGLGEPVTGASAYEGTEVRIGALRIRPDVVVSWPDAGFPTYVGAVPDGVIGYDLLRTYPVLIDAAAGRVVAFDSSAPPTTRRGARPVPLRVTNGLPVVEAEIFASGSAAAPGAMSASLPVVIDFGAGAGLQLSRAASERLGLIPRLRDNRPRQLIGIGGAVEVSEGVTDSLRIAGAAIPNALVAADTTQTPSVGLANAEGFVGTEILRRFAVTLDYARGRAVFEPNALLRAPFCRNAAGACVRTEAALRGAEVVFVDPGSTAARAGLRPGNLILAIDGVAVAQLSGVEIDRLLDRTPGVTLEIIRNAAHLRATARPDGPLGRTPSRRVIARERTGEMVRLPPP